MTIYVMFYNVLITVTVINDRLANVEEGYPDHQRSQTKCDFPNYMLFSSNHNW